MPDLKSLLNDEIRRLARKEVKIAMEPVLENIANLKKLCAEQKKQIQRLEKALNDAGNPVVEEEEKPRSCRLNAAGIIRIRGKLKLTQSEFGKLLGVTMHTVSIWEQEKCAPRPAMKEKICALRTLGKRKVKQLLEAADAPEADAE